MKKFSEFVNEKVDGTPVFSWERADMWFERIEKEPEIQQWIGTMIMPDSEYNKFKKLLIRSCTNIVMTYIQKR